MKNVQIDHEEILPETCAQSMYETKSILTALTSVALLHLFASDAILRRGKFPHLDLVSHASPCGDPDKTKN